MQLFLNPRVCLTISMCVHESKEGAEHSPHRKTSGHRVHDNNDDDNVSGAERRSRWCDYERVVYR